MSKTLSLTEALKEIGAERLETALKDGTASATGCVDGGERRIISAVEWFDYRITVKPTVFSRHHLLNSPATKTVGVLSSRSFPAAALKCHGYPSGVMLPSAASLSGEPGYHRVITDVRLPQGQIERLRDATATKGDPGVGETDKEEAATVHLAKLLKQNPELIRDDGKKACRGFDISERGYLKRVWPEARKRAWLSPKALPGAKKSKR
jgi:hypothetical protein